MTIHCSRVTCFSHIGIHGSNKTSHRVVLASTKSVSSGLPRRDHLMRVLLQSELEKKLVFLERVFRFFRFLEYLVF